MQKTCLHINGHQSVEPPYVLKTPGIQGPPFSKY